MERAPTTDQRRDTVVVGASSGGIAALRRLLGALPEELAATLLIVMHQGRQSGQLDVVLRHASALPVTFVVDEIRLERGRVYLAPPDRHLIVVDDTARARCVPARRSTRCSGPPPPPAAGG